jgi:hypothetical protein
MTETPDLAARLLAAIERAEQGAGRSCGAVHPQFDTNHPEGHPDPAVVRRCAADRKTIKDWQEADADIGDDSGNAGFARGLYRALERLAEGYGLTEQQEGQP